MMPESKSSADTDGTPKVSVIIPMFNAETTIVAAIGSALCQTLTNIEVLVVDDGSTDSSVGRIAAIQDPRLRILRSAHGGAARARNVGIAEARGQFITFLDSDDMWTADKLETQTEALSANPEAWAVYSWTVFCDGEDRYLFAKAPAYASGDVYVALLTTFFLASGSNALTRRECVDVIGGFNPATEPAEDWEFWLRCAKRGNFVVVPRYQIIYRFTIASASASVEHYQQAIERISAREFAGMSPAIRRRQAECLSNVKQHACMIYMHRSTAPRAHLESGKALLDSVVGWPSAIFERRTLSLFVTWLALCFVPRRKRIGVALDILRHYGRWASRATPELRSIVPRRWEST
jgi:glycosyltransferase involved in cell wall biosynthesis